MAIDGSDGTAASVFVYVIPPIDLWFGWKNLEKVPADSHFPSDGTTSLLHKNNRKEWRAEVDRLLFSGRKFAEAHLGYRGDIARGPFLSQLPGAGITIPLVAWESEECELTFVASPVPLPHLEPLRSIVDEYRSGERLVPEDNTFGRYAFRRED